MLVADSERVLHSQKSFGGCMGVDPTSLLVGRRSSYSTEISVVAVWDHMVPDCYTWTEE